VPLKPVGVDLELLYVGVQLVNKGVGVRKEGHQDTVGRRYHRKEKVVDVFDK
jgi:hypothetical protein